MILVSYQFECSVRGCEAKLSQNHGIHALGCDIPRPSIPEGWTAVMRGYQLETMCQECSEKALGAMDAALFPAAPQ